MDDLRNIQNAIELYLIRHFETHMLAGSVKARDEGNTNYLRVDLIHIKWDRNLDELHRQLSKYLVKWARHNNEIFNDPEAVSSLIVDYRLEDSNNANSKQSKFIKLFNSSPDYQKAGDSNSNTIDLKGALDRIRWGNTIIVLLPVLFLIGMSVNIVQVDVSFQTRLLESYSYINIANGIIASFVLGFIITKVTNLRENKLKHTKSIRQLSNQLTYFRNICFNLARDHVFWNSDPVLKKSYVYANSIKHDITYLEYCFPDFDDTVKSAKFNAYFDEKYSNSVVSLILQLHYLADQNFLDRGLSFTESPPDYVYTHGEMESFYLFHEDNRIWYSCSETQIFPEAFARSGHTYEIMADMNRIYPDKSLQKLTRNDLEKTSIDFQYRVIPNLYHLTRYVERKLPLSISYFMTTFILLIVFGLILPTLMHVFIGGSYSSLSIFPVIGIISHILLSIKPILKLENHLDRSDDYL